MPIETLQMLAVFALLGLALVAFAREWASPEVVALAGLAAAVVLGTVSDRDLLGLFSNSAPVTIGAMFVLSAALERTGVIQYLAARFEALAGRSELRAMALLAAVVMPLSAFVNNTPIVVVFLPVVMAFCRRQDVRSSKLLIPLSFFAILGGTITLLGTSTNLLVAGQTEALGLEPFDIFEITPLGILYALGGLAYMLTAGRWLLPSRDTLSSLLAPEDTRSFCSQAVVRPGSPLVGKKVAETRFGREATWRVFEVLRHGRRVEDVPVDQLPLEAGDVIVFKAPARAIAEIQETEGLEFDEEGGEGPMRQATLVEGIIGPDSSFLGRTIRELKLRRTYGVVAAALHRHGKNLFENFQDTPLEFGDTVIFEGPVGNIAKLKEREDFLSLNESTEKPFRSAKAPLAIAAILAVVGVASLEILPISSTAFVGAVAVVLLGCLTPREALAAIEWKLLLLIIGMLGLGKAMENTGGAAFLAGHLSQWFSPLGPVAVLAAFYLFASILTEFVTNNAVAILLPPIAVGVAQAMGVDARPFLVAIMFAASASFCTPIGYQTNTYVYGAGGYKFTDFPKIGIPLNLLLWFLATALIPLFWKF